MDKYNAQDVRFLGPEMVGFLEEYQKQYPGPIDPWQLQAIVRTIDVIVPALIWRASDEKAKDEPTGLEEEFPQGDQVER